MRAPRKKRFGPRSGKPSGAKRSRSGAPGARRSAPTARRTSFPRKRPRDASPAAIQRLLDRQDWNRVRDLLTRKNLDAGRCLPSLREFCARVIAWNRSVSNLISKNDEGRIVERHLVESIEHVDWLRESGSMDWVDFGSGAGFPAIPLAVVGVGARWTLVESRRIKTLFLRKTLESMAIGMEMAVLNARLESIAREGGRFDGFTARAAGNLTETLGHASSLLIGGGSAFLWKGSRWRSEIEKDRSWEQQWTFVEHRSLADPNVEVLKFLHNK